MPVTFDAVTPGPNAEASSATWSHTCTGTDRYLVVGIGSWATAAATATVTYNAVSVPEIATGTHEGAGGRHKLHGLAAPATGANNVVVTFDKVCEHAVGATSYTDVHQSAATGTPQTASGSTAAVTVSVGSATAELVVAVCSAFSTTFAVGSPSTERWDLGNSGGIQEGAYGEQTGAAVVTMAWTLGIAREWGICAISLKSATVPPFAVNPPEVVGAGTAAFTATASATVTPGLPTFWAADDVHILIAAGSNNLDWPEPSGWTKLSPGAVAEDNTTAQRVELWARRAVGGDTAPVLSTYAGTTVRGAQIYGIRGCSTHGPVEETISVMSRSNNAASATVTWATITPPHPQTQLLALFAYEDDPTAATTITDWTAFATGASQRSALGTDMLLSYANRTWATEYTATGALTTTVSGGTFANSVNVGVLLAFISDDLTAFVEPFDPIAVQSAM